MDPVTAGAITPFFNDLTVIIIAMIVVLGPVTAVFRFVKSRGPRGYSAADLAVLNRIANIADRMDQRMAAVEQILAADGVSTRHEYVRTGAEL